MKSNDTFKVTGFVIFIFVVFALGGSFDGVGVGDMIFFAIFTYIYFLGFEWAGNKSADGVRGVIGTILFGAWMCFYPMTIAYLYIEVF